MGDIGPNAQLVMLKLRQGIAQQENYVQQQLVGIAEAIMNIRKAKVNMEAGKRDIETKKQELAAMEEEHGVFSGDDAMKIAEQLIILSGGDIDD